VPCQAMLPSHVVAKSFRGESALASTGLDDAVDVTPIHLIWPRISGGPLIRGNACYDADNNADNKISGPTTMGILARNTRRISAHSEKPNLFDDSNL